MENKGKSKRTLDNSRPSLLIKTLGIPLLDLLERSVDPNFDERNFGVLMNLSARGTIDEVG